MNIVIISQEYPPYLVGGTATHIQELIKSFAGLGYSMMGSHTAWSVASAQRTMEKEFIFYTFLCTAETPV